MYAETKFHFRTHLCVTGVFVYTDEQFPSAFARHCQEWTNKSQDTLLFMCATTQTGSRFVIYKFVCCACAAFDLDVLDRGIYDRVEC